MKIRLAIELRLQREPKPEPSELIFEHRDTDSLVENAGAPRYIGFQREDELDLEDGRKR